MKPTVGRSVHFYPPRDEEKPDRGDGPYAAIVTDVAWDEVKLEWSAADLVAFGERSIYFHQAVPFFEDPADAGRGHACWTWPPRVAS